MVVAKTLPAQTDLVKQLQERTVSRCYQALVVGEMISGFTVDAPIERHPRARTKMAVAQAGRGKEALTHIRVLEKFKGFTLVEAKLETGRTHQIRVHMAHKGYPLVGDPVYGGRLKFPKGASDEVKQAVREYKRQALHAWKLALRHPISGEMLSYEANLPQDMQGLLAAL